ncbi:elongator complex protein 1 [Aphelenchoides avenae]|nr:elongator complex protein 1 [Aphelenchus avenae]
MENLKVYAVATSEGRRYEEWLKEAEKVAIDSLNATTFFALPERIVGVGKNMEPTTNIDISGLRVREPSALVMFDFLSFRRILWMVFESGAIYAMAVPSGKCQQVVGLLPGPIRGGAWSPDLQLLSVASDETLFTVRWDCEKVLWEGLLPAGAGKDQLMKIGWGSRGTQFQGAAGRQKREKVDVNKIPVPAPKSDDRRVIVSWRADSKFFTVSHVDKLPAEALRTEGSAPVEVDARQLCVWNREDELMSRCEVLAGMEPVLAMRPSGNVIATTRVLAGFRSVWFFEPNGQYRDDFDIGPAGDLQAESISWNSDSSVLTVHMANVVSREHQLQFWTAANDRWSLKLQLNSTEPIVYAAWDPENAQRFHLLKANGRYERVELERTYNCTGTIAVSARGSKRVLVLTPLRGLFSEKLRVTDLIAEAEGMLSHYELKLPSTVVGLCQSASALAVLMSDGALTNYILESRRYVATKTLNLARQLGGRVLYGLQWKTGNVLSARRTSDSFEIVEIGLEQGKIDVVFTSSTPLAWHAYSSRHGWYICEFEDGKFAQVDGPAKSSPLLLDGQQVDFRAVSCHQCQLIDWRDAIVGLSRDHQLIVNGNVVHSAVGSYRIAGTFLLTVTLTGTLFAIPLANLTTLRSGNFPTDGDRAVERGATLIAHEPRGTRIWLQMPRGNLEMIQPRVLLVQQLRRLSEPPPPACRQESPVRLQQSPVRCQQSQVRRQQSPARRQRSKSSVRRQQSPARRQQSPARRQQSPARRQQSLARRPQSPARRQQTPAHRQQSPIHRQQSQDRRHQSPDRRQHSPVRRPQPPARRPQPPARRPQSPIRRQQSPDRRHQSPDRRHQSPDGRQQSLDRRQQSPVRRQQSPVRREQSPVRREQSADRRQYSIREGEEIPEDVGQELWDDFVKEAKKGGRRDWIGAVDAMLRSGRYVFVKAKDNKDDEDVPMERKDAIEKLRNCMKYRGHK